MSDKRHIGSMMASLSKEDFDRVQADFDRLIEAGDMFDERRKEKDRERTESRELRGLQKANIASNKRRAKSGKGKS